MGLYGVKSVMISNSRGFCIELATAMVVIVAARFGWVLGQQRSAAGQGGCRQMSSQHCPTDKQGRAGAGR